MPAYRGCARGMNESLFRRPQRAARETGGRKRSPEETFEIVCECAREDCTVRIPILVGEYEAVRSEPTTFVVVEGHADPAIERVVDSATGYEIVEKLGEAAARRGDSRIRETAEEPGHAAGRRLRRNRAPVSSRSARSRASSASPPSTLRTWERRYRLVVPHRGRRGQRLYDQEQVATLRRVLAHVRRGARASAAHDLALIPSPVRTSSVRIQPSTHAPLAGEADGRRPAGRARQPAVRLLPAAGRERARQERLPVRLAPRTRSGWTPSSSATRPSSASRTAAGVSP